MEQNRLKILGEFEKDQAWHGSEVGTFQFLVTGTSEHVRGIGYLPEKHSELNF